jgi:hypothetical protein
MRTPTPRKGPATAAGRTGTATARRGRLLWGTLFAVAVLGVAARDATAQNTGFGGEDLLYTYDLRVRPNVVLSMTDTEDMMRFAYPYDFAVTSSATSYGYTYRNCTTTSASACPTECGPAWTDGLNYNCPSYHYGTYPAIAKLSSTAPAEPVSFTFAPANCTINDPLFRHLVSTPGVGPIYDVTLADRGTFCEIQLNRVKDPNDGTKQVIRRVWYSFARPSGGAYTGDEWNQATATVHSALWGALFGDMGINSTSQLIYGYLKAQGDLPSQWRNYSNRFRVALQRLNMLPPNVLPPTRSYFTGWSVPDRGNPGLLTSEFGLTMNDGLGGCMTAASTPLPTQSSISMNLSDMFRYMFWPTSTVFAPAIQQMGQSALQGLTGGGAGACTVGAVSTVCPDNRMKHWLPLAEMLGDAGQYYWGGNNKFCAQSPFYGTNINYTSPIGNGVRLDDFTSDSYMWANNFVLMFTTNTPSHDNATILSTIDWRSLGAAANGDHDFSCTGTNCSNNQPLLSAPDFPRIEAGGYVSPYPAPPVAAAQQEDYEAIGSNFLDDMAAVLWHADMQTDPSSSYPTALYRTSCAQENLGPGRTADCRRQAVTTDIIGLVSSDLFRNAANQSMGFNLSAAKPRSTHIKTTGSTPAIPGLYYDHGFGRNCDFASFPERCYGESTIARALNHWFLSMQFRNVNIDKAYYPTPPVLDIDPSNPGGASSNKLIAHSFVPTPGSLYEGHTQAWNYAIGQTNSDIYVPTSLNDPDEVCGGFGSGRRLDSQTSAVFSWLPTGGANVAQPFQLNGVTASQKINDAGDALSLYEYTSAAGYGYTTYAIPGGVTTPAFNRQVQLANRNIYTRSKSSTTTMIQMRALTTDTDIDLEDFELLATGTRSTSTGSISANDQNLARKRTLLDWLYNGTRSFWDGHYLTQWRHGDSTRAGPVVVSRPPKSLFAQAAELNNKVGQTGLTAYRNFWAGEKNTALRPRAVIQVTNAGYVHAFDGGTLQSDGTYTNGTGRELWAYMPRAIIKTVRNRVKAWHEGAAYGSWTSGKMLTSAALARPYGIDAEPVVTHVWIDSNGNGVPECPGEFDVTVTGSGNPYTRAGCEWKTLVLGGMGRGAPGVWALNVTDPTTPAPWGECDLGLYDASSGYACDQDTTYTSQAMAGVTATPEVFRIRVCENDVSCGTAGPTGDLANMRELWVAAIPFGYHSRSDPRSPQCPAGYGSADEPCYDSSSLLGRGVAIVNLRTMRIMSEFRPNSADAVSEEANLKYAVTGGVRSVDTNDDGYADRLYFGDLGGQLFRVTFAGAMGLNGSTAGAGKLLKCVDSNAQFCMTLSRLFTAPVPSGTTYGPNRKWQAIWTKPAVAKLNGDVYVGFGTGDRTNLIDDGRIAAGKSADYLAASDALNRDGLFVSVRDAQYESPVTISGLEDRSSEESPNAAETQNGWYWQLPLPGTSAAKGERVLYDPVTIGSSFAFTTSFPSTIRSSSSDIDWSQLPPSFLTRSYTNSSHLYVTDARTGSAPATAQGTSRFACCSAASASRKKSCEVLPGIATGVKLFTISLEEVPTTVLNSLTGAQQIGGSRGSVVVPIVGTSTGALFGIDAAANLTASTAKFDPEEPIPAVRMLYFREIGQ